MQLLGNSDVIYFILMQFRLQDMAVCRHGGLLFIRRRSLLVSSFPWEKYLNTKFVPQNLEVGDGPIVAVYLIV